jgi:hypothetical protein
MSPKLVNYLSKHTGKWYEVLAYCKENDPNETPDLLAKFVNATDALIFAQRKADQPVYTCIVLR